MKRSFELGALVLSFASGCTVIGNIRHDLTLLQYNPLTAHELRKKENAESVYFNELGPGLANLVKKVYVIDGQHFVNGKTGAHAHSSSGIICLKRRDASDLFHEAGHLRSYMLENSGSDFSQRWKNVASISYGELAFKIETETSVISIVWKDGIWKDLTLMGPRHGCLSSYGSHNWQEDVSTFLEPLGYHTFPSSVESDIDPATRIAILQVRLKLVNSRLKNAEDKIERHIYTEMKENAEQRIERIKSESLTERVAKQIDSFSLYFADRDDPRYIAKIDLLFEYGFVTVEQRVRLIKELGSLRHYVDAIQTE